MIRYARASAERMFTMDRTQVRIWNVLHEGPLEAGEIINRLPGTNYFDFMNALLDMVKQGTLTAITEE